MQLRKRKKSFSVNLHESQVLVHNFQHKLSSQACQQLLPLAAEDLEISLPTVMYVE